MASAMVVHCGTRCVVPSVKCNLLSSGAYAWRSRPRMGCVRLADMGMGFGVVVVN